MKKILLLTTLLIFAFCGKTVSADFSDFVGVLQTEIQDTNIIFLEDEYCIATSINAQYAYYATERTYVVNGQTKSFTLPYNTLGLCSGYWGTATNQQKLLTLTHELGHAFWYKRLSDTERGQYTSLHNASSNYYDFYRAYGRTNELEDFSTVFESLVFHYNSNFIYPSNILKSKRDLIKTLTDNQ